MKTNDEIQAINGETRGERGSGEGPTVPGHTELEPAATPQAQQSQPQHKLKEQRMTNVETCKNEVTIWSETPKDESPINLLTQ